MSAEFVDTNVFVYVFDEGHPEKRTRAAELVRAALDQKSVISYQVVQETLSVLLRKMPTPLTTADAQLFLTSVLEPLWRIMPSPALFAKAMDLHGRLSLSYFDALIIAAALQAGCSRLITEDMQHGQRIDGLVIHNPFLPV